MPRTLLKVFGGGGGGGGGAVAEPMWCLRVSLVFTFGPKPQLKFGPS